MDDFALKCKAKKNEINSNAFLEIWPQMSQKLDQVLRKYYSRQAFDTEWSKEIQTFLILVRLLPFKHGARSLASAETFQNSIKRLLVFSDVLLYSLRFIICLICVSFLMVEAVCWLRQIIVVCGLFLDNFSFYRSFFLVTSFEPFRYLMIYFYFS